MVNESIKILAIPHVGDAFGHIFRVIDYINWLKKEGNKSSVSIVIPQKHYRQLKTIIPDDYKIFCTHSRFSVNNSSGRLLIDKFLENLKEKLEIADNGEFDLLIGDPGVFASIIANKLKIKWKGIAHGCYIDFLLPKNSNFTKLKVAINKVVVPQIDSLIKIGSEGRFSTWSEIKKTGEIIIPNEFKFEPSEEGIHINFLNNTHKFWQKPDNIDLNFGALLTLSSGFNQLPPKYFIDSISKKFGLCLVAGGSSLLLNTNGEQYYLGNNLSYRELINQDTVVFCHGGHSSIKSFEKVKTVFLIPSDVDQLTNSIIACHYRNWKIIFDRDWEKMISSLGPFTRKYNWEIMLDSILEL